MIDAIKVIEIHDLILSEEPGLHGDHGIGPLEGALARIDSRIHYEGLDDIFEIAAMYAVAVAREHVFNDANKRTALVTALTYLALQGVEIPRNDVLEEIMVDVADGSLCQNDLAECCIPSHLNCDRKKVITLSAATRHAMPESLTASTHWRQGACSSCARKSFASRMSARLRNGFCPTLQ